MDTIFAIATAPGKAGVAIVRISGPAAFTACRAIAGDVPARRQAALRRLATPDGGRLDDALVLTFGAGHSFTGEDTVEFQLHGSPAVTAAVMEALGGIDGCRPAAAGEFTRRALENGCLDLAQVEGLADLIDAETEAQRRQAQRVFAGDLGAQADLWRQKLVRAAALVEATIDFADEEIPTDVSDEVLRLVDDVIAALESEIRGVRVAERIRSGFEVAIVGAPNVGKSTLLNALAGREAAITSEHAGTTRDIIEVRLDLDGLPVSVLDTAGLRRSDDAVERIGVDRARDRALAADLRVFLVDGDPPDLPVVEGDIVLRSKGDLLEDGAGAISGQTGAGIPELIDRLRRTLGARSLETGIATRARHAEAMRRGLVALKAARPLIEGGEENADLAAEELRSAIRGLDSLVGRVDIENVLDEIFASFCIGK